MRQNLLTIGTLRLLFLVVCSDAVVVNRSIARRKILSTTFGLTTANSIVICDSNHPYNIGISSADDHHVGETIRREASKLPGYGPSDIVYPSSFLGKWTVQQEDELVGDDRIVVATYVVRFLPYSIHGENGCIADRGFNEVSRRRAIHGQITRFVEWKETNPNDLRLLLDDKDGTRIDLKVTKRALERPSKTQVWSSEFRRLTIETTQRPIPIMTAQRILTKWKVVDDTHIEGLELTYDLGELGGSGSFSMNEPLKSRLHLVRYE
jgi:hypothetical protein